MKSFPSISPFSAKSRSLLFVMGFFFLGCYAAFAGDTLYVQVLDENEAPVKSLKIRIHTYPAFYSNAQGSHALYLPKELEMPFDVAIDSKTYEITKFNYYKEGQDLQIHVKLRPGVSGRKDNQRLPSNPKDLPGHYTKVKKKEDQLSTIAHTNASSTEEQALTNDSISVSQAYLKYKGDFEKIAKEIHKERERLMKANEQIKNEIALITERLDREKNLSPSERDKLKAYLKKLEAEFEQNAVAFRKSEEQTRQLIQKLKMMLLEKDSLNAITTRKLEIEKEKRMVAEEQHTRSFAIFSIITLILLLIAFSFYFIARKIRKQKTALQLSNQELSEQKKRIEEQNQQLDIFAYKASHDLKGPLKSITALSELAQQKAKDKETSDFLQLIHVCSVKLDQLITDLLTMAKDSKSELAISDVNVTALLDEVLHELKDIDRFQEVQIRVSVDPALHLLTDHTLLRSIIQNLVENAIKYSDASKTGKTLDISSQVSTGHVSLSFKDNGIGIAPEFQDKVFQSFFRTSHDTNGTGLGLYIVKQNVHKLGGDISLTSEPGYGSVFTVQLPLRF